MKVWTFGYRLRMVKAKVETKLAACGCRRGQNDMHSLSMAKHLRSIDIMKDKLGNNFYIVEVELSVAAL